MTHRHGIRIALTLAVIFWIAWSAPARPEGLSFQATPSTIHLPGEISCLLSCDLDGDGVGEAAVGYLREPMGGRQEKTVAFFKADGKTRYGPRPFMEAVLPWDAGVVDLGDANGDRRPDLVFTRAGMVCAFFQNADGAFSSKPVPVVMGSYNLPYSRGRVFSFPILRDMNNDGRQDLLLPTLSGYELFCQAADGTYPERPDQSFPLDYGSYLSEWGETFFLGVQYRIPLPTRIDINGDGFEDLAFADGGAFRFFPFDPKLRRYGEPKIVDLPIRKEAIELVVSQVDDFDADGLPDIVVHRAVPQKVSLTIDSLFFRGKPGPAFNKKEDGSLFRERQIIPPRLMDLDGNGRKSFVTFSQRLTVDSIIDYFVRNRVGVDVAVHPPRDGVFNADPIVVRRVFLKLDEREGHPGAAGGDFNGDGRDDLIYTPNSSRLDYILADEKERLPRESSYSAEVPSFGKLIVEDINHDGKDDVAIIYEIRKRKGDLAILISGSRPAPDAAADKTPHAP